MKYSDMNPSGMKSFYMKYSDMKYSDMKSTMPMKEPWLAQPGRNKPIPWVSMMA